MKTIYGILRSKAMRVLRFKTFQEKAHFREPKVLNDNLVCSLPLPPPTTVAGMLTYLNGERLGEEIDIAIIGKYEFKSLEFMRTESSEWVESYKKEQRKKDASDEHISDYKKRTGKQGTSTFEILNNLELEIFVKTQSDTLLQKLLTAVAEPSYYPALGRKEDYVKIIEAGIVEIEEREISQLEALALDVKLQNTYVPFDLKADDEFNKKISQIGSLYVFPKTYNDINVLKHERKFLHSHYLHISENSYYLRGKFYIYQDKIFQWLVNPKEVSL